MPSIESSGHPLVFRVADDPASVPARPSGAPEGVISFMDTMRAGVSSEAVDAAARGVIEKAGFGEYFRHRLGYSIGVNYPPDWGEGQILSLRKGEPRLLEENMTFHMVPLCLVYREFGIGFSATVRVTRTGCEEFSALPRTMIVK